jgi:hypothetical protein
VSGAQLVKRLQDLGIGRPLVDIVIPAGFSFSLDGSAVYLTMAFLLLAQAAGIDLSWQQKLDSIGTVAVAALALIVGVDRILNQSRCSTGTLVTRGRPSMTRCSRLSTGTPRTAAEPEGRPPSGDATDGRLKQLIRSGRSRARLLVPSVTLRRRRRRSPVTWRWEAS